jgi:hypothetical protein
VSAGAHQSSRRTSVVVSAAIAGAMCWMQPAMPVPTVAARDDTALTVLSQDFNIAVGATMTATVGLPEDIDPAAFDAEATLNVVSYPVIKDREGFLNALDGSIGDADDEFEISLDPLVPDPYLAVPAPGSLTITVPTLTSFDDPDEADPDEADPDPADDSDGADEQTDLAVDDVAPISQAPLRFELPGVHPVAIRVSVSGRIVARTTTFVHAIDPDGANGEMSIGVMMGQTTEPTITEMGTADLTAAETEELGRLADTLAAIDAVPGTLGLSDSDVPRGVFVEPATLQAVMNTDAELAARLTPGLMRSAIVGTPRLPFEPSAAAAAGQAAVDRYTGLLRDGEDLLRQLLPRTSIDGNVHIVREPFTTAAAELQRNVGARLMVMGFDLYERTSGGNGPLTDTSQLVWVALPNSTVATALIDPHIAERIENGADDPLRTAIQIVADLLVTGHSIDDDGGIVSRHGLILARSDAGVPDAQLMGHLMALLATTDGVRLVEPASLLTSVDNLLRPGGSGEVAVTMPSQPFVALDNRLALIDEISQEIFAFADMLPSDAPQIDEWLRTLEALPSSAVDDVGAAAMVQRLRAEFDVYRTAIEGPEPFTFTLTSRSNTLTFSLRNNSPIVLEVRVRLSSPKLTFPDGDQVLLLPPGEDTEVNVRAEALSNGKSSVFLRVYTPTENSDIQLMPEVVLTARVSSLAGVGQLLTGAFLLLLIAWWGRHWQQSRRKRIAGENVDRHPSNGTQTAGETSVDDATSAAASNGAAPPGQQPGEELAPDAAASSLPPS